MLLVTSKAEVQKLEMKQLVLSKVPVRKLKRSISIRMFCIFLFFIYAIYILKLEETYVESRGQYTNNLPSFIAESKFVYVIENGNICKEQNIISSLIVVHSATQNGFNRAVIRSTWGNSSYLKRFKMKLIFFLGYPSKTYLQRIIEQESNIYYDIVQGSFLDTYKNLTHKSVLVLRWISENCLNVNSVIKIDDDVFLNVPLTYHATMQVVEGCILCDVQMKGDFTTNTVHRYNSKWTVSITEFTKFITYPFNFCSGYYVILHPNLIKRLYDESKDTPMFWIDDVFVYGILAQKIGNVSHKKLSTITRSEVGAHECLIDKLENCSYIGVLTSNAKAIHGLWEVFKLFEYKYQLKQKD